ncbi:radical SAM/SPASM domain-containing protein [Mycobacterium paraseoulense]|uniref:Radical SAM core domain-containing protein n=1 Tax=Mycobacterium paraseoulense TaxID=590652 RepID=A0A1X0I946_9MYCO|nr:SPASM domain-containing protein [Mycobacterium paraseoulense]MCV7398063.1 SPASM domain-containing protein [Mycobacterium paraseoulense]ORB39247.1 hypothetical protein BST39_15820 [Mycobacterium paraseoulense]BBZ74394.1 radical SAM/SPASM domain-containing protein [Mycobacterium paraseoulense]
MKRSDYVQEFSSGSAVVLTNLLWRTFARLTPAEAEIWRGSDNFAAFPDSMRASLLDNKMLIDDGFDELSFIQRKYDDGRFSPKVLGLTIAPTIDCNFGCAYCYEDKRPGRMTAEVEQHVVDYVERTLPGKTSFSVTWYGGEPLMCKETICRLSREFIRISDANGASYEAFMVTNGWILTEEVAAELANLGHWANIQFTIDGFRADHDAKRPTKAGMPTFDRVCGNLIHASSVLPVTLRMNVDLINPDGCHKLLDHLAASGAAARIRVYFAPIHPFGKGCRDIAEAKTVKVGTNRDFARIELDLITHAEALGFRTAAPFKQPWLQQCQAVSSHSYVVEPDGSLQRCWIEVGEDDKRIGHITSAVNVASPENMRWMRFDPTRNDPCKSCPVLPVCFGSCPHRHVDGAPEEFTCNQIRWNVKDRVRMEYQKTHPEDIDELALPMAPPSQPGTTAFVPLSAISVIRS